VSAVQPIRAYRSDRDRVMVTPEGIALPLRLASRVTRAGALILDFTMIGVLMIVTTIALAFIAGGTFAAIAKLDNPDALSPALQLLFVVWIVAMFLFRNAWFLLFELGPRGATPGKRMSGIRIAARDGGRLTAEMVIARNLLRDIELFLPLVFLSSASDGGDMGIAWIAATAWFLIFALFPFFNADRLRAGDVIAGTWVIEAPRQKLEAAMSLATRETRDTAAHIDFTEAELAVYGEYELQTLERVLREGRAESLAAVYEAICRKLGRNPYDHDARAFLDAFYTRLRARLESGMRMGKRKADKHSGDTP